MKECSGSPYLNLLHLPLFLHYERKKCFTEQKLDVVVSMITSPNREVTAPDAQRLPTAASPLRRMHLSPQSLLEQRINV